MNFFTDIMPSLITGTASGIAGISAVATKMTTSVKKRVSDLETSLKVLKKAYEETKTDFENHVALQRNRQRSHIDALSAFSKRHEDTGRDVEKLQKALQETVAKVAKLEQTIETAEKTLENMDREITNFIKEQGELWRTHSGILGQIQGKLESAIQTLNRRSSGNYPQTGR